MTDWIDFYGYVRPSVSGCPIPTLDIYIRQAAIEFCRRTLCDVQTLDDVTTNGKELQVELDLPSETQIIKITGVAVNGRNYALVDAQRGLKLRRNASTQEFAFTGDLLTLDVNPFRSKGDVITVDAALAPTVTASGVSDAIASRYMQEIATGALSALQWLPGMSWSDPKAAMANKAMFSQRIDSVAMFVSRGQLNAKMQSSKTYF